MKRAFYSVLAAAILAVMVAACGGSGSVVSVGGSSNAKWEYMVFSQNTGTSRAYVDETDKSYNDVLNQKLNELGAQGWELVSSSLQSGQYTDEHIVILKRKL